MKWDFYGISTAYFLLIQKQCGFVHIMITHCKVVQSLSDIYYT